MKGFTKLLKNFSQLQIQETISFLNLLIIQLILQDIDINAIKELLGHANLSATQVYTHNTIEKLKTVYKQAHPRA